MILEDAPLVEWETLEAHTVGLRQSDGYQRELLQRFYSPFPVVEHLETVFPVVEHLETVFEAGAQA